MRIIGSIVASSLALLLAVTAVASAKGVGFGRGVGVATGSVLLPTRHPVLGPVGASTGVGPRRGETGAIRLHTHPFFRCARPPGPAASSGSMSDCRTPGRTTTWRPPARRCFADGLPERVEATPQRCTR